MVFYSLIISILVSLGNFFYNIEEIEADRFHFAEMQKTASSISGSELQKRIDEEIKKSEEYTYSICSDEKNITTEYCQSFLFANAFSNVSR